MRIKSLDISGFRAFSGRTELDLDGDIVLVVGVNGQGKTSLFDAIHWAITGSLSRLNRPGSVVSLYSHSGEARVSLTLIGEDNQTLEITRHSDGEKDNLLVRDMDETFRGEDAEYKLLRRLWPNALAASEARLALRSAFERGVYLQQDVVTEFLSAVTDQDRFKAIGELIGAGRANELQAALERSRRSWSRVTNQLTNEMKANEERLSRLEAQLLVVASIDSPELPSQDEWADWWEEARRLGVRVDVMPSMGSSNAQNVIDLAMAELRTLRLSLDRHGDRLRDLTLMLHDLPSAVADIDAMQAEATEASKALAEARQELSDAERENTESHRRLLELRSEREELRVLAEIALRHLGEQCPVCQQTYDEESTRERLESMLVPDIQPVNAPGSQIELTELIEHLHAMEERASEAAVTLRDAQRQELIRAETLERIRASLADLLIDVQKGDSTEDAVGLAMDDNAGDIAKLVEVTQRGEELALSLARAGQLARQREIEDEVQAAKSDLSNISNEIAAREATGQLVTKMINELRDASAVLVGNELARMEPLLQRIYATADPHPEFRLVKFISRMYGGSGRMFAEINDPSHNLTSEDPNAYLSSSQMNVLAVSVFLALNLGIATLPLSAAILDDPLQSLDDLNLLGLIDLLKRMREQRQMLLSTHDRRFASLLERKLRPVAESQRTILVELGEWSSEGPSVTQRDVARDLTPFRIVAA